MTIYLSRGQGFVCGCLGSRIVLIARHEHSTASSVFFLGLEKMGTAENIKRESAPDKYCTCRE